jgi:hypothetical protein
MALFKKRKFGARLLETRRRPFQSFPSFGNQPHFSLPTNPQIGVTRHGFTTTAT